MSDGLFMEQIPRQQLSLNARMMQSLEILQMPLQELNELVTQSLYDNPLLEIDVQADTGKEDFSPVSLEDHNRAEPILPEERPENAPLEVQMREIWNSGTGREGFDFGRLGEREVSFTEMLDEQIGAMHLEPAFAALCHYLVACLNRRGYLDDDPAHIAQALSCPLFDVMQGLYLLQSLQPTGVGARSLQECLLLQLVESKHFNAHTIKLVQEGLALLADNQIEAVAKLLGLSREKALQVCNIVRALHPIPSQGYYTGEQDASIVPDALVRKEENGFTIVINNKTIPRLELSHEYCDMLSGAEPSLACYLQAKLTDAKQLMRAVDDREKTLYRIICQVVAMQSAFFENGTTLHPMSMASVAEALDLSVSTVSRAVSGKYIVCSAGTVELKSFFTTGVQNSQGTALSNNFIKLQIRKFVDSEDRKHPLSDEHLREALRVIHIDVSRRTVAKYREAMGIPSSSKRRR
ncbi:MAG: RNA polymerase factor sigma-54 [Oscillospiraceae bacterium]|nr:RNA polymerase factor sigma-54 [Oscillospiraceae bacterium]